MSTPPDEIRNDPAKFYEWQRRQNEGAPLRVWAPAPVQSFRDLDYCDAQYNAVQGSHFNLNGWGRDQ